MSNTSQILAPKGENLHAPLRRFAFCVSEKREKSAGKKIRQITSSQTILNRDIWFAVALLGFLLPCSYFRDNFACAGSKQLLHTATAALSGPETFKVNPCPFEEVNVNQRMVGKKRNGGRRAEQSRICTSLNRARNPWPKGKRTKISPCAEKDCTAEIA